MLSFQLTPRLHRGTAAASNSNAAASNSNTVRLVAYGGAVASLIDGMTTFIGLRSRRAGEVNTFQAFAIRHYGLSTVIELRVLAGAAIFVVSAAIFSRCSGWQRQLLVAVAGVGLLSTVAFDFNNAGVLLFHHRLVPPSLLHALDVQIRHLLG